MNASNHDDLERRLTELFQQRAATVTRARPVDLGADTGDRKAAGPGSPRLDRHRQNLGLLAAAAAVFIAIAGTIVGIQAHRHQPAPPLSTPTANPSPTATPSLSGSPSGDGCLVQAPASWRDAIQNGALPAESSPITAISVNGGTGDYLVLQNFDPKAAGPSGLTLGVFNNGGGRTFFTADSGSGYPQVDGTSAVTAGFVTFALLKQQDAASYYKVMLYDRATQETRVLAGGEPPGELVRRVSSIPVLAAGKVFWLSSYDNRPETTRLESWDLAHNSADGPVPAANASGLVGYGSGVALERRDSQQSITLGNGAGTPLTKAQLAATVGGNNFGFDGSDTLSWLGYGNGWSTYFHLRVGSTGVSRGKPMRHSAGILPAIYPFTDVDLENTDAEVINDSLLDLRTGAAVRLPDGIRRQAVVGDKVIFGIGTTEAGAARLSLVPVSSLPPVRC